MLVTRIHRSLRDKNRLLAATVTPSGVFERPFNANTMDVYFLYLDIVDTFVYQDNT